MDTDMGHGHDTGYGTRDMGHRTRTHGTGHRQRHVYEARTQTRDTDLTRTYDTNTDTNMYMK